MRFSSLKTAFLPKTPNLVFDQYYQSNRDVYLQDKPDEIVKKDDVITCDVFYQHFLKCKECQSLVYSMHASIDSKRKKYNNTIILILLLIIGWLIFRGN